MEWAFSQGASHWTDGEVFPIAEQGGASRREKNASVGFGTMHSSK